MNYPKYESYKDSGIDWLGEIPRDWGIVRFTDSFVFSKGLTITKKDLKETGIPCISYGEVHSKYPFMFDPNKNRFKCVDNQFLKTNRSSLINYEDFIYADTSEDIEGSGNFSQLISKDNAIFAGYHTIICRYQLNDNKKFIAFFLDSLAYRHQVRKQVKGVKVYSITQSILKNTNLCLPTLQEQNLIAKFLDQKTSQIDEAIRIKEKQIELLKEQKQIMIQNAVTKGLDPNVKMKDSGVDWIGEIPEHWSVLPGFTIFKENKDSNKGMKRDTVLSLSYGNIIIKPEEKLVGLVPESFETYQLVNSGDIIIRCTDLQNDKTSLRTGIARDNGIITSAYINLRVVNSSNKDYVHEFLHVFDITKAMYKYGSGLRQNLTFKDFKYLSILQPSIKEQNEIVEFLAAISKNIEDYNELLQQQISKLKEYKTTLINSAVTGKIKVTPEMVGEA
ncbi:hypothetical protein B9T20_08060 [Wohlfahrtiimonas sp. G9077]|nr:hypothetical protein B9T20_08060 [Wohlfahrtiimonas sp. G9077]